MLSTRILIALPLLGLAFLADGQGQSPAKDQQGDPLPPGAVARLGQDRWLHGIRAQFAEFLPDGKTVVTVNSDLTIRVWEFPSGKEIRRIMMPGAASAFSKGFGGPSGPDLIHAALSKDGKTVATAYEDGVEIFLHDVATGKELPRIKMPAPKKLPKGKRFIVVDGDEVEGLAFSPDGKQLASLTVEGDVIIWDWANGKEIRRLANPRTEEDQFLRVVYAPDGKSIAVGYVHEQPNGKRLDTAVVKLWDAATAAELRTIRVKGDDQEIEFSLAFSPDSKTLAMTTGPTITLVETATGKQIGKLGKGNENAKGKRGFAGFDVVYSTDGTKLYVNGDSRKILEWDVATRKLLREFTAPNAVGNLSLAPDGGTLVVADQGPQFFDLCGGKDITPINKLTEPLLAIQFLADGKHLLTRNIKTYALQKWDAISGTNLGPIIKGTVNNGAVSRDGKVLARLTLEKNAKGAVISTVVISDVFGDKESGRIPLREPERTLGVEFSPDGKTLAIAQPRKQKIELYEVTTAKLLRALEAVPRSPNANRQGGIPQILVFSADGKMLAWYENPSPTNLALFDTATGKRIGSLPCPKDYTAANGAVRVTREMERPAFSPDGRCLAMDMQDGTTVLYELATAQPRSTFGQKIPRKEVLPQGIDRAAIDDYIKKARACFAFAPDGKTFVQAGPDGIVHLWAIVTGKELTAFKGHTEGVNAVAFAPDGKSVASASADSTALIWDVTKVKRPAPPLNPPPSTGGGQGGGRRGELQTCWEALAENDAAKAFAALGDLVAAPKDAVPWIKERVKPAPPLDMKRVDELLVQLDDNQYKVREKATAELFKFGERTVLAIDKVLAASPPLETKQRLEALRAKLTGMILQGDRLRDFRAIEILERIGTPESRQVLETLAAGAPGALVTVSAKAALKRL